MKILHCLSLLTLAVLVFSSCDENRVYEKNIIIEKYNWSSDFKTNYTIEIKDTTVLYNLYINIRHADFYPFRNIWLMVTTQIPYGTVSSKRIEVMLANDAGKWFGDGLGDIWDYRTNIQENTIFKSAGTYSFTIEHIMRQDPLPGIMSVGFRLEKTDIKLPISHLSY